MTKGTREKIELTNGDKIFFSHFIDSPNYTNIHLQRKIQSSSNLPILKKVSIQISLRSQINRQTIINLNRSYFY